MSSGVGGARPFPFAWYQVAGATAGKAITESGNIAVADASFSVANAITVTIDFDTAGTGAVSDKVMTDRAGRVWYYAGSIIHEAGVGTGTNQVSMANRQGSANARVKLNSVDKSELAVAAGQYKVTLKASGNVKIDLAETTYTSDENNDLGSYGTSRDGSNQFDTDSGDTAATGALGAELLAEIDVFTFEIEADGDVTYGTSTAWATPTSYQNAATFYYGIDVGTQVGEGQTGATTGKVSPKLYHFENDDWVLVA